MSVVVKDSQTFKATRLDKGYTLEDLASRAGCSYISVYRAERGAPIGDAIALKIAKALGLTVSTLFSMGVADAG